MMVKWQIFRRNNGLGKILANEGIDPELVKEIEQTRFGGEGNDPSETLEGIRFLMNYGKILKPETINSYAESISLENLLNSGASTLPAQSPLRMIVENDGNNGVLKDIRDQYPGRQNYYYSHGVVVSQKRLGYGSALFRQRLKMLVGENELMFGFIMAYPPNIPAIRMALKKAAFTADGAVIDRLQEGVYMPGIKYFRWVYDKRISYGSVAGTVSLEWNDYMTKIAHFLNAGFVATKFKEPNELLFNRRI